MPITPISLTQLHGSGLYKREVQYAQETGISIDSDTYTDEVCIEHRHLSLVTFTIYNSGANSLDFTIYGHLDENGGVPPAFSTQWAEIPKAGSDCTIATDVTKAETLTENWAWLLIRMKRTAAGQSTTATFTIRARQNRI